MTAISVLTGFAAGPQDPAAPAAWSRLLASAAGSIAGTAASAAGSIAGTAASAAGSAAVGALPVPGEGAASDNADIRGSLDGDPEAYARLIGRYQQQVASRMRWFSRQPGVAEELVQDVFVEAYLSLRGYRGQAPFAHWLQRIATRVGYRHWKLKARERRRGTSRLDDHIDALRGAGGPEDAAAAGELVHVLLAQLAPRDRLVLTLLYLEGRSVAEAAELAGWSVAMIKVQAFRARGKLKRLLEKTEA